MPTTVRAPSAGRFLDFLERVGNRLPDPTVLFIIGALLVMIVSHAGYVAGWTVQPVQVREVARDATGPNGVPVVDPATGLPKKVPSVDPATGRPRTELVRTGEPIRARSLLTSDGLYWCISSMVRNFMNFPPLGIVLVAMLGVGVAEKTGLFDTLIKAIALLVPRRLLTPTIILLGILSHIAGDSGYIVLPPLAAVLYITAGRSPLAGIAAAFAGVSAGFSASLLVGPTDALIAGITQANARILDPSYQVDPTSNWYFMAASAVLLTLVGWAVSARFIEPRLRARPVEEGGPPVIPPAAQTTPLTNVERRAVLWSLATLGAVLAVVLALIVMPGWPLNGTATDPASGRVSGRWVGAIVPIVFVVFLLPGLAYGMAAGTIRTHKDAAAAMVDAMRSMAPVIVMAFFAAQFIEYFTQSNLGRMLAIVGGTSLAEAHLGPTTIVVLFVLLSMLLNLLVSSMSAKFLLMAPIFVPMFMMLGISPELTQAAYRIGDSVTNVVTPMNAYMIVILAVMQKHARTGGVGTLISMMMPYCLAFAVVWTAFLLAWITLGLPLGPGVAPHYTGAGS